jgi:hypothetical protein
LSHTLLILKIYTIFKDVQMMLKWFFDISTGFRFSKNQCECSVHSCSCPCSNQLNQCSTGQRFIFTEVTSYKIHILRTLEPWTTTSTSSTVENLKLNVENKVIRLFWNCLNSVNIQLNSSLRHICLNQQN